MTPVGDENVRRLDVAVNNAFGVRRIERVGHLDRQSEQALELHRLAIDQVLQRLTGEALHHDKGLSLVLADLMDRAYVRMIQS